MTRVRTILCIVTFACVSLWVASVSTASGRESESVQGRAIKAHTTFLAHDLLEGRDTGQRGYDIAAAYVAAHFEALGLEPGNGADGFHQPVPLRRRTLQPDGVRFSLRRGSKEWIRVNGTDIAVDASATETDETFEAELVFVGWGITAPGLKHDDYAGLDVKGKAVVLVEGAPASFPGALRAHYSWIQQKERMAAEHGAIAVLTLKSPARERISPFERTRQLRPLPQLAWREPEGRTQSVPSVRATITLGPQIARDLFAAAGRDLDRLYRQSESRPPRGFDLRASMRLSRRSTHEDTSSPNVVGVLRGTDPHLANEYVAVVAHLDHVGIGSPVNGDAIYNGAVDNAGGVATILEVARAISSSGRTKRSILFLATTGEEKGLIGSDYFVAHPTVPLQNIVAAISVDGLMAFHDFGGIVALGAGHSTLGAFSLAAARTIGAVHVPDPIPERGNLALSDQYPFLRAGIPVLFPNPARGLSRDGRDDTAAWDEYETRHYHQPSDDMRLPLRWDVAERWGRYIDALVRGAANAPERPLWYEADLLAAVFAPGSPRAARPDE
jgi:Zn-dependent M28 family amino/carboxypeptidase